MILPVYKTYVQPKPLAQTEIQNGRIFEYWQIVGARQKLRSELSEFVVRILQLSGRTAACGTKRTVRYR